MLNLKRKFWIIINRIRFKFHKVKFGNNLRVCNSIYFKKGKHSNIQIGNTFAFYSGGGYNPLARNIKGAIVLENDATIYIGNNVGISCCCIRIYDSLIIKDRVKIGGDCIILDSDAHSLNYIERRNEKTDRPNAFKKGITIEEDVLIGTRCIILKGITIGARSIIGSGSVVTRNIPPDEIWAGNPAKFIRKI